MTLSALGAEPTRRRFRLSPLARAGLIRLPLLVMAGMALGSALTLIGVDVPSLVPSEAEAHSPTFLPDVTPDPALVAFAAVAFGMSVLVNVAFGPFRLMSLWVLAGVVAAEYALLGGGQLAAHLGDVDAAPAGRVVAPVTTPASAEPTPVLVLTRAL